MPQETLLGQVPSLPSTPSETGSNGTSGTAAKPDWLPEEYWEGGKGEIKVKDILDRLAHNQTALRHKKDELRAEIEAELKAARPAHPSAYTVDPAALTFEGGRQILIEDSDPVLARVRAWAFDNGVPQEKFTGLLKEYGKALVEKMPDPKAELAKLGENAAQRIQNLKSAVTARIGEEAMPAFMAMANTAQQVEILEKIMGQKGGPTEFDSAYGTPRMVSEEIDKIMASDAYWKRDPATLAQLERLYSVLKR